MMRVLIVGFVRLEMPNLAERVGVRTAIESCGPANEGRAPAKQYEDLAVPIRAGLEATLHTPAAGTSRLQRRRGRGNSARVFANLLREFTARRPTRPAAQLYLQR